MDNNKNKKFEELYQYSKDAFNEELKRSVKIDDKASKYLSILTAVIGLYTLLGRQLFADVIPPQNIFQLTVLLFAGLVLAGLIRSWYLLFSIIKTHEIQKPPLTNEIFIYFDTKELYGKDGVYYGLAWNNKLALEENRKTIDKKISLLNQAYNTIAVTVVILLLFVGSTVVNEWLGDINDTPNNQIQYEFKGKAKCQIKMMK